MTLPSLLHPQRKCTRSHLILVRSRCLECASDTSLSPPQEDQLSSKCHPSQGHLYHLLKYVWAKDLRQRNFVLPNDERLAQVLPSSQNQRSAFFSLCVLSTLKVSKLFCCKSQKSFVEGLKIISLKVLKVFFQRSKQYFVESLKSISLKVPKLFRWKSQKYFVESLKNVQAGRL